MKKGYKSQIKLLTSDFNFVRLDSIQPWVVVDIELWAKIGEVRTNNIQEKKAQTTNQPTTGKELTNQLPANNQRTNQLLETTDQQITNNQQTNGKHLTNQLPTNKQPNDNWQTNNKPITNKLLTKQLPTYDWVTNYVIIFLQYFINKTS